MQGYDGLRLAAISVGLQAATEPLTFDPAEAQYYRKRR